MLETLNTTPSVSTAPAPTTTRRRTNSSTKSENSVKQKLSKDDKRQRNTEASARFRIKKKLREQALQRTAYEMTEKAKFLENRVQELEKEVKWLRALVVEKNEVRMEQLLREKPAVNTTPIPSFMTAGLSNFDDMNASLSTASSSGNH